MQVFQELTSPANTCTARTNSFDAVKMRRTLPTSRAFSAAKSSVFCASRSTILWKPTDVSRSRRSRGEKTAKKRSACKAPKNKRGETFPSSRVWPVVWILRVAGICAQARGLKLARSFAADLKDAEKSKEGAHPVTFKQCGKVKEKPCTCPITASGHGKNGRGTHPRQ